MKRLILFCLFALVKFSYAKPSTADTNTGSVSESSCVCVPKEECLVDAQGMTIVHLRTRVCSTTEVCCQDDLSQISEDDFANILGLNNETSTPRNCVCIHEDQCDDPELSIFSLVRTGSRCSEPLHVCCENPLGVIHPETTPEPLRTCKCVNSHECADDLQQNPSAGHTSSGCIIPTQICCDNVVESNVTIPDPGLPGPPEPEADCTCVHEDDCFDPDLDLFLNVNLRTRRCTEPFHVCCKDLGIPATTLPPAPSPYENPNCGVRDPNPISIDLRVAGGRYAQEGEYPWMVAIMRKNETGQYTYACGGSLIHPSVVLTVAHCIQKDDGHLIQVRIGELDLSGATEVLGHAEIYANGKVLHPYFSRRSLRFDLGLLFLEERVMPTRHINTICLPTSEFLKDHHNSCYSSGWGKDAFGDEGEFQSSLKKIDLPLVSHGDCQAALRTTHLTKKFKLHRTFMCAGGEGKDTCSGDGGSPLVCPLTHTPKKQVQVGAVAWGIGCGTIGIPGVYASIEPGLDWIVRTVNNNFGENASDWFTI